MKLKHKIGAGILTLGILMPFAIFADDDERRSTSTASSTKDSIRERLDEIKERAKEQKQNIREEAKEKKEELKDLRDESRDKVYANVKNKLSKFLRTITKRFEAAIERLRKLAGRIESRIAKLESEGKNMTEAKGLLDTAKIKINLAASSTAALKLEAQGLLASSTASTTASTTLRTAFKDLQEEMKEVKNDIKEAHASLVDVIKSLKPGRNKATTTATTTDDQDDD